MSTQTSTASTDLRRIPHFNAARRYRWRLLTAAAVLAGVAVAATATAFAQIAAALWLAVAGFLSAALMAFARSHALREPADAAKSMAALRLLPAALRRPAQTLQSRLPNADTLADWPQALLVISAGYGAITQIAQGWSLPSLQSGDAIHMRITGALILVGAFALVVLQRTYAALSTDLLPEAPALDRLLRLPLTACLGSGVAFIAAASGLDAALQIEHVIAAVVAAAGVELVLRGMAMLFLPWPPLVWRRGLADSAVAGFVLRLRPPSWRAINTTARQRLGINLSRSWALAFLQKALLPLAAGILIVAWLSTGLTTLRIDQRGIYQRLGAPAGVLGPGLHAHLPWPFGTLRTVEIGVVHQLPIEFVLPGRNGEVPAEAPEALVPAEAPAPESADRLWDDAHPYEGSYLIASEENGRQSFQLVDVDMAVIYQVGVSDQAARNAAYRISDPDGLIQALSGQILVRFLAQHQLLGLLGESRESLSAEFRQRLQEGLDRFAAGIDVLAISIEAIHPPPGAASAYHDVQAAEIRAGIHVAQSRAAAARSDQQARQQVTALRDDATAAAAERVGTARTDAVLFGGDRVAAVRDGNAFLLERWFDDVVKALGKTDVVIVDHRLKREYAPTLDLRPPDKGRNSGYSNYIGDEP